nr:HWE histidine kinase domain-containing protein [Ameyamaea chiangmaiensis]
MEPIHIPGSIQPHGAMLVLDPSSFDVVYWSSNVCAITGFPEPLTRGTPLAAIIGHKAVHDVRNAAARSGGSEVAGVVLGVSLDHTETLFDATIHRYRDRVFVELEPSMDGTRSAQEALDFTQTLIRRIGLETEVDALARAGARLVRAMLGYDRVMVYQFLHNGAGQVIAEARRPTLNSFMDQRFPAADIPYQARRLYLLNTVRMIGDASYQPDVLRPALEPGEQPVDMSFAQLRSVSPIHCEYLQNMGVSASMSLSIVVDGELWGLISCHHDSPRITPISMRIGAELFVQYFSLQISIAERRAQMVASAVARRRLDDILATLSTGETLVDALQRHVSDFMALVDCQGVGVWINDRWTSTGDAPSAAEASDLVSYLAHESRASGSDAEATRSSVWHTQDLRRRTGKDVYGTNVAGAMAVPLSATPRDYLIFFRSEEAHEVVWAGEPVKRVVPGAHGPRLSPRGSFDLWREDVRHQSRPWRDAEQGVAEAVRTYLRDIFLKQHEITAEERNRLEHRRRVLNDELNHRVKNIITLVKSIALQTGTHAATVEDYSSALEGRLRALAFAHDQSISHSVGGDLATLIAAEAGLHRGSDGVDRITVSGEQLCLNDRAFGALALVIHELMTNAAKYGALSVAEGLVDIAWERAEDGSCTITWRESGGPPVKTPVAQGFGSRLIQSAVTYDLGGSVDITYDPAGLIVKLGVPGRHVSDREAVPSTVAPVLPAVAGQPLRGKSVLLLEDQSLIALDTEDMLRKLGALEVRLSPDAIHARLALGTFRPDVGVLDFNLNDDTSAVIGDLLVAMNIPFVFATGYGDNVMIPERFRHIPVVRKPVVLNALSAQIAEAFDVCHGPAAAPQP